MKVVLSNKAYFNCDDDELWEHCCAQTTYQIFRPGAKFPEVYITSSKLGARLRSIPASRLDILQSKGIPLEIVDKRICVPAEIPKPSFTLRKGIDGSIDQQEILDACDDTCLINGNPGFGKTITALAIAHKLQQKTLVICTNVSIREQWEAEIEKWFGFKPGVIGSGKYDISKPITVSNIQTVNKHSTLLSKEFGLVIVDEVHHCVATTFSNFLEFSHARYKIGLSGTLKRKDGLNVMFKDYFGYTIHIPSKNNVVDPEIHIYPLEVELSGNQMVAWANRANDVYNNDDYRDHLIESCYLYWKAGHKVLFVSDRTELIEYVGEILEEFNVPVYKIIGSTANRGEVIEELSNGGPCVLTAAQSIFSEGISVNSLSCLITASLLNNEALLEQLVGRIQRIVPGKPRPIVVDTMLKGGIAMGQARGRRAVYINNGWDIVMMTPEQQHKFKEIVFAKHPQN